MMEEWLAAPRAYPEARSAIGALEPAAREALDRALEPIDVRAGETLFAPGDPRDATFMIVSGRVALRAQSPEDSALPERVFVAGEGVGEIGLSAHGPHTSTARALDNARVLRLGRIAFEGLCERFPEAMSHLAEFITPVAHETLLARVICDLLGEHDAAQLAALLAEAQCVQLKRGEVLVREGEDTDRLFVVISGRLRIVGRDAEGLETVIDEIGPGDTCGERSLLTREPRSTTVYALRDSAVGVITRPVFENLKRQYPEVMTRLTRIALRRVQRQPATLGLARTPDAMSFAVLAVGARRGGVPLKDFAERLRESLVAEGSATQHLNSARVDELLGMPGAAQVGAGHPAEPRLAGWLLRQEQGHSYVIYEADAGWSPWTERCLRMADRVLLVGLGAEAPAPTELDEPLASHSDSTNTELVLLQPDEIARPAGTAAWLTRYAAAGHHHVRLGRREDFERFVRRVTGRGLGLVLGGGGARGFAHIGVFKALAECGVVVDLVGGTSIGAILSGTFAMGLSYQDTLKLARQLASPFKLFDPTVPVVAVFASRKVTHVLERLFGDTRIEDLWTPCFCVSSNLTHAVAMVHRRGPLWQAVRASMAVPGVFSPILADGDLLVDGCVLNNLPIDVMQRLNHDGPIIAVNVFPDVDLLRDYRFGPSVSGWQALASKLNPLRRQDESAPLIFESLVRVLALNDVHQAKTKRAFADVYIRPPVEKYNILDFGAYTQIAEIGYRSARRALEAWLASRGGKGAPGERTAGGAKTGPATRKRVTTRLRETLQELEAVLRRMEGGRG